MIEQLAQQDPYGGDETTFTLVMGAALIAAIGLRIWYWIWKNRNRR